jgi:hypothetical protein
MSIEQAIDGRPQSGVASVLVVPVGHGTRLLSGQDPQKSATDIGGWGEELRDTDIKPRLALEGADLQGMVTSEQAS